MVVSPVVAEQTDSALTRHGESRCGVWHVAGPSNPHGLRLQSFRSSTPGGLDSRWQAKETFEGFPGLIAAGVIATLMECQVR